jgi:imidazolonepropionase-like amidohydrolase
MGMGGVIVETQEKLRILKAKRLLDGTGAPAQEDVALLVADNIIREIGHRDEITVPPGAEVLDLEDRTIMPGIVDAHMHFFGVPSHQLHQLPTEAETYRVLRAAGEAKKMLEAGVTAARCLGSSIGPSLRRAINEGHVPGPRVVASGEFICSTDGTWDHISVPLEWVKAQGMIADGVEGVREVVRRRVRQGANVIKVGLSKGGVDDKYHPWGDDPFEEVASYSLEEIRALTSEAHLNRLKVSAHCIGDEAVRNALEGGVDVIEHGYGITEETRKRLVERNALIVTTISQLYFHEEAADPYHYPAWQRKIFRRHIDAMRADFEKSLELGVRYALGTDLVGYPTHPQDMAAKEFELSVAWGMDPMQAIVAGTKVSAEALSMDHLIGTIEVGKLADIIGFSGDPLKDITVLQHVEFVMQDGDVIVREERVPTREG